MWFAIAIANAQSTAVFRNDVEAAAWIQRNEDLSRAMLPILGPALLSRVAPRVTGKLRFRYLGPNDDPSAAAYEERLTQGSPCALVLTPLEEGWAGWTSGSCGMLGIGGWRWDGRHVVDGSDLPVMVTHFARSNGDFEVLDAYKKLDRARSRSMWLGILGTGLLFAGAINAQEDRRPATLMKISGGVLAGAGLVQFAWVQNNPKSNPRRLDAHYTQEELMQRIRAHNKRLQLSWSPAGISGTY